MDSQNLYQRVLGKDFSKLPDILQQFHSRPQGGCAEGRIHVESGAGILRHGAAQLLRLPRAGTQIPLHLQVIPQNGREVWIRHFDGHCVETVQWQEGSFLVEKAGPLYLVFQVAADENGLTFTPLHIRIHGIRLPSIMSLRVRATAHATHAMTHERNPENCWQIEVIINAPLLGTITTYRGGVIPQPC